MADVEPRLANRVQLSTDGHKMYLSAVEEAFGWNGADFAQVVKQYGNEGGVEGQQRYSPAVCTGIKKEWVMGKPDMDLVSTSYVERANLSMRMGMRRFTRSDQRLLQKGREPRSRRVALLHVLQLLPPSPDVDQGREGDQDHASDGREVDGSRLDRRGNPRPHGPETTVTLKLTHYPAEDHVVGVRQSRYLSWLLPPRPMVRTSVFGSENGGSNPPGAIEHRIPVDQ